MVPLIVLSAAEQVAAYLRAELRRGAWSGLMPGGDRLATELGVGRDTVEAALRQLENEGLLVNRGRRRGRGIARPSRLAAEPRIHVGILLNERADQKLDYMVELQHQLADAGHGVFFAPRSMSELGGDVKRIARMIRNTKADAWITIAGSREMLAWFVKRGAPAFALFGRRRGLTIAGVGPEKPPAMAAATRALLALGHRRIVLLVRPARRLPQPGATESAFLAVLAAHGIAPGPYHLPDWDENVAGFHARLDSLFQATPPTALIVDEAAFFVATLQFCANRGLRVPQDLSLVCTDADPSFDWCQPAVAHIRWSGRPLVRRILRWAENVSRGKQDLRQTLTPAKFVAGGTIGPVKEE